MKLAMYIKSLMILMTLYILGPTADKLCKRMAKHRGSAKCENLKDRTLYFHIILHGIEYFKIILVEEYKNINRETLRKYG